MRKSSIGFAGAATYRLSLRKLSLSLSVAPFLFHGYGNVVTGLLTQNPVQAKHIRYLSF